MTGEARGLRKSVHSSQLWGNKHIMIKQIGQKRSKEPHKSSVRIDCGVKNCPCIVRMSLHRLPGLSRRGLHYYIVARARKHQQKSPIHSRKNKKKLALAYTALHTTHAQRIQILRNKIVNAQDPSKYLLYCHTLYNAMAWSDIGDNARALSTHVHTCLAQHYLKMTCWDEERWVEDGSVLTIMHQEPGLTGPESYFTLE